MVPDPVLKMKIEVGWLKTDLLWCLHARVRDAPILLVRLGGTLKTLVPKISRVIARLV